MIVLWIHCTADFLIAVAYVAIAAILQLWSRQGLRVWREVNARIPHSSRVFAALFLLGAAEHSLDAVADLANLTPFLLVEKSLKAAVAVWVAAALWRHPPTAENAP